MLSNFDYWKPRASSVWNLFSEPKTIKAKEAGDFSETCKSYLHSVFLKEKYDFYEDISHSKYLQKGIMLEEQAIGLVNELLYKNVFIEKNTVRKSNDFVTGECDMDIDEYGAFSNVGKIVSDTKCSWSLKTFHKVTEKTAKENKQYGCQLNTYKWLYGADTMQLCYCLLNTPKKLAPFETWYDYELMIPKEERLKTYTIDVIPNFENELKQRVNKAREYLNTIKL
jgi:hypothetical protein